MVGGDPRPAHDGDGWYALTARASLELGAIVESRGDRGEAARHYRTALALGERGGPEIAGWRSKAAEGLRRTAGR